MTLSLVTIGGQNIKDSSNVKARSFTPKSVAEGVGRQLRDRRMFCGLSREELSEKLQIDLADLNAYEEGRKRVSASLLLRAAKYLDVRPTYFFSYTDDSRCVVDSGDRVQFEQAVGGVTLLDDGMRIQRSFNRINSAAIRKTLTIVCVERPKS